ncbi:MAG: PAS domain-containing protein [Anaerolineaceae bacterium]|nr:PAS domain-containing protein [Anaerolineaceae bacterium]
MDILLDPRNLTLLEFIPGFVCIKTPDHSLRYVNQYFKTLFNEPGKQPCFKTLKNRSTPCPECPTANVFNTRRNTTWEWTSPVGKQYQIYDKYIGISQNIPLVLTIGIDITQQKITETKLRKSEEHSRMIADFTYDWEYWMDNHGKLLYNSPSCKRITGRTSSEFLENAELLIDIVHPEDKDMVYRHLNEEASNDQAYSMEYRIHTSNGEERWIEHVCQPVFDPQGQRMGRRASNRDGTERKYTEFKLRQAERLATVGRLIASLAHEINNPLQAMTNSIELIMDFPLAEDEKNIYLNAIRQEIEKLMEITRGILDFARPKNEPHTLTNIENLIQQALKLSRPRFRRENINISLDIPPDCPDIIGSPEKLSQVFLNLIINAVEQMNEGGEMTISALFNGDQMEIRFSDTGSGIAEEDKEKIFQPFYTTKLHGTGLGLSISQRIIMQHHGKIIVQNNSAGGADFIICLPIPKENEQTSEQTNELIF